MITNILLGLILGVVITSFIILNKIYFDTKFIIQALKNIDEINQDNNELIKHLLERFNKRTLIAQEYYGNIITLLNNRFKDLDNATDSIYDRCTNIEKHISAEHIITRNEMKKQAKISSKINSKKKTK